MFFSFLYLYVLQPSFLCQLQFQLSAGQTHYVPLVGALLITLLLTLLGMLMHRILPLPVRMQSLAWFPSCCLLMLLTCWPLTSTGSNTRPLLWIALLAVIFVLSLFVGHAYPDTSSDRAPFIAYLSPNLIVLSLLFLLIGRMGNTATPLQYELRMARLIDEGRYEDALRVGEHSQQMSRRLTSMRCYALCETGQMGDRLFHYTLQGGSQQMLPLVSDTLLFVDLPSRVYHRMGYVPREADSFSVVQFLEKASQVDTLGSPVLRTYLLCAHLLDHRLPRFVQLLAEDSIPAASLPEHYREALVLYASQDSTFESPVADTRLQADFDRFLQTMNADADPLLPEDRCRRDFANTYWYYYFFR